MGYRQQGALESITTIAAGCPLPVASLTLLRPPNSAAHGSAGLQKMGSIPTEPRTKAVADGKQSSNLTPRLPQGKEKQMGKFLGYILGLAVLIAVVGLVIEHFAPGTIANLLSWGSAVECTCTDASCYTDCSVCECEVTE